MKRNVVFARQLRRYYGVYTLAFALFVVLLAIGESLGLSQQVIGHVFLFVTIAIYATIGVMSRTSDVSEYYVAGRRVPAMFNGMATAADWMSAASFIGLAGTLYYAGFEGLAFVTGWTGGFVLVALLLAPYLRKFGQYTIPDFLGARYQGNVARLVGLAATVLASFVYLVAQIYGVGLVTSRFVSVEFEIGLFIGLAGILVCSFLGGMRAVTWTQVAQYVILIIAYLVPVVILSYKLTGIPIPQAVYGTVLQEITAREDVLLEAPTEVEVRRLYAARAHDFADKMARLPDSLEVERRRMIDALNEMRLGNAPARDIALAERALRDMPRTPAEAQQIWERARLDALERSKPPPRHAEAHPGATERESAVARNNFLALMFVLMVGTAALPHILMRYYTTPGVMEARRSVMWSLFFIFLLYVTAPAYAVFAKWEVYHNVVGSSLDILPDWVASWGRVGLVRIEDLNGDGRPDLVVGNKGLNSQVRASDQEPASLYFKDFDNNGTVDPILSFYIQGKNYPYITRDELVMQMSSMGARYPDYKSYADVTLDQLFSSQELESAGKLEANYFKTACFINMGTTFQVKELPLEAQFSPVFAITTLDYDQDGKKDLWLGGNISQGRLRLGKFDANYGLLLRGDGQGGFVSVPQQRAGFALKGDVRSVLSLGNRLLFGVNQQAIKAYRATKR